MVFLRAKILKHWSLEVLYIVNNVFKIDIRYINLHKQNHKIYIYISLTGLRVPQAYL